ncbi:MAG: biotin/lipoyl-binding protein [Gemmatimonadaceae bacterium]|nr:biotin/lipoyl-binding protein [Gemmatimonadaceae bacterium]
MTYLVDVEGERITVAVTPEGVTVDGRPMAATLERVDGGARYALRLGERVVRIVARADGGRGQFVVEVDGQRMRVEALDSHARALQALSAATARSGGPVPLKAPMPGLIVRVTVAPGDVVAAGQGLVVMEAMKMENELRAASAGVVRAVHATPGQAVEKGALLVELGEG